MNHALRPRAASATIHTIVLAAATIVAADCAPLLHSFEAQQEDWQDQVICGCFGCDDLPPDLGELDGDALDAAELARARQRRDCPALPASEDDHCYRDKFNRVVRAWDRFDLDAVYTITKR